MADIIPNEDQARLQELLRIFNQGLASASTAQGTFNKLAEKGNEERKKELERQQALNAAAANLKGSFTSLTQTIKTTDDSFASLSGIVKGIGNGMSELLKTIPFVGNALGALGKAATSAVDAVLSQTDALFAAKDALAQFGTAGAYSTEEIRKFGLGAGLTVYELTKFTNATKSLGIGLVNLGGSSTEGIKAFAGLIKTTEEQRRQFLALGITNDKLVENTTFYVDIMTKSGFTLRDREKTEKNLQKSAHDYTKNLLMLADITGADIETIKQRQMQATAEVEFQVNVLEKQKQIKELIDAKRFDEAKVLQDRLDAEKAAVEAAASLGSPEVTAAIRQFISTGFMTGEAAAALQSAGFNTEKLSQMLEKGSKDVVPFMFDELRRVTLTNADSMKTAIQFNKDLQGTYLVTKETLTFAVSTMGKSAKEMADDFYKRTQKGIAPEDEARSNLIEALRRFRTIFQDFIAAISPGVIDAIGKALNFAATKLGELEKEGWFTKFADGIKTAGTKIGDFVKNLFSEEGRAKIYSDLKDFIKMLFKELGSLAWQAFKESIFGGKAETGNAADTASRTFDQIEAQRASQQTPMVKSAGERGFGGSGVVAGPGAAIPSQGDPYGAFNVETKETISYDQELDKYLRFTGNTGSKEHFKRLDESLQQKVLAAAKEYSKATGGKKLQVNSAFRSLEEQTRIYGEKKGSGRVAQPGNSLHERGKAIDINEPFEAAPFLYRQGLIMPYPKDDSVHFQEKQIGDGPQPKPVTEGQDTNSKNFQTLAQAFDGLRISMSEKLDMVINRLSNTNDIQEKILKAVQS